MSSLKRHSQWLFVCVVSFYLLRKKMFFVDHSFHFLDRPFESVAYPSFLQPPSVFLLHFCTICFWTVHEIIDNTGLSVCFCIMKLIWPKVRFLTTIATTRVVFLKVFPPWNSLSPYFSAQGRKNISCIPPSQFRRGGVDLWKDQISENGRIWLSRKNNSGGRSGRFF